MDHVAIDLGAKKSQICLRVPTAEFSRRNAGRRESWRRTWRVGQRPGVIVETRAEAFCVAAAARTLGHETRVVESGYFDGSDIHHGSTSGTKYCCPHW
jgi:hypothetical protein